MRIPRLQLYEFNDDHRVPESLRDVVIETLSRILDTGGVTAATVPVVSRFLDDARAHGCDAILDIGAGAGGPAEVLCREFARAGLPPLRIIESDLFPRVEAWEAARQRSGGAVDYIPESVDATAIPPDIAAGRARMIMNAFHHFPPSLATAILEAAVRDGAPILIVEGFERDPLGFLKPFVGPGIPSLLGVPLRSPKDWLKKAFWTWFTPIGPAISMWDGVVSAFRIYAEDELRAMVLPFGSEFEWEYGNYDYPNGGRGMYFRGMPKE